MWRERERERDARLGLCAGEGQGDGLLVGREMMRWGRCENMYRGWRVDKERRTHLCVCERVEVRVRTHSDSIETKCEMVSLSLSLSLGAGIIPNHKPRRRIRETDERTLLFVEK